ncbi:MAG: hypothetical protein O7H41_21820 [Planctomycetota bacterium]|nr:hypothetical protein [Planctomycetota bacterium]
MDGLRRRSYRFLGILLIALLFGAPAGLLTASAQQRDDGGEGAEKEKEPQDPLESVELIKNLMTRVEELLAQLKTGHRTQEEQQRIIDQLTSLIDVAQSRGGGGGGGGQVDPNKNKKSESDEKKPGQQSKSQEKRKPEQGARPLAPPKGRGRSPNDRTEERREAPPRRTPIRKLPGSDALRWGNLPPRDRRDALDQKRFDVPARFRADVEKYFKRLADTPSR